MTRTSSPLFAPGSRFNSSVEIVATSTAKYFWVAATAVLNGELTAADLTHVIHAHPTLSEAILEASHAIYGHPIHI